MTIGALTIMAAATLRRSLRPAGEVRYSTARSAMSSAALRRSSARRIRDTPFVHATSSHPRAAKRGSRQASHLVVPEAVGGVVVDHADGLHERVADRRSDEPEAAPLEVAAHGLGGRRLGGDLTERGE